MPGLFFPALIGDVSHLGRPVHLVGVDAVLVFENLSQGRGKGFRPEARPLYLEILLEIMAHLLCLFDDRHQKARGSRISGYLKVFDQLELLLGA